MVILWDAFHAQKILGSLNSVDPKTTLNALCFGARHR